LVGRYGAKSSLTASHSGSPQLEKTSFLIFPLGQRTHRR
jgi:hypothetical protein